MNGAARRIVAGAKSGQWLLPLLLLCLLWPATARTQSYGAESADTDAALERLRAEQPLSDAAIRGLVARLDDDQVREFLIAQVNAQRAPGSAPETVNMGSALGILPGGVRQPTHGHLRASRRRSPEREALRLESLSERSTGQPQVP